MPDRPLRRARLEQRVRAALARSRAVVLAGPRQSGKTTLARQLVDAASPRYFDLENPLHAARLEQPLQTLAGLRGLVVIDEVQRMPALFPVLRVLLDRSNEPGRFLLLGSASPALLRQSSDSLLGRVETLEVGGFDLEEVTLACSPGGPHTGDPDDGDRDPAARLWLRGGYPRSYLADSDADSLAWRLNAARDHVEVDLPQFGAGIQGPALMRFWLMVAHVHGAIWSAADPARSLGVSETTVRRYLDLLTQTMMLRQLQPWYENLGKRQVKSAKVYFRDSGLLHALMGVTTMAELLTHPRSGASWEGFALEQVLRIAQPDQAYFWSTHQGAELDLLLIRGAQRIGVEFKRADVPRVTPSMRIAAEDLALDRLYVVYPGPLRFELAPGIEAVPLGALLPA